MRISRALALLTPVLLAFPSAAAAQTQGGINITMFSVSQSGTAIRQMGDADFAMRGYNAAECAVANVITTQFSILNLPSGTTFVDAWLGNGTQDCSTAAARQTGNGRVCTHLAVAPTVAVNTVTLTLTEMLDPSRSACDSTPTAGATYTLWFFATGSTETTAEVTPAQYGYVSFRMDVVPPAVPTVSATTLSGSESVAVTWDALSTNEMNTRFRVFVDDSVTSCTDAGQWMAGGPAPTTAADYEVSATSARVSLTGIALGGSAMVYVSAIDVSENASVLSAGVCVNRIETVGFCEALEASGQPCTKSCVASGPRPTHGGWWLGAAVIAVLFRRRSRS